MADRYDDIVVGGQAVGIGASELSSAFRSALEVGATLEERAATVHAHPTLSEGFRRRRLKRSARVCMAAESVGRRQPAISTLESP